MKKTAALFLALAVSTASLTAASPKVTVNGTAAVSTSYLWRGDRVCGLHAAPDIQFHIGDLTIENYSFLALDGSYKEIDLDFSYRVGDFTFHAADYFARYSNYVLEENYFSWAKGRSNHIDEVAVVYEPSSIPLIVKWFTFVWGDYIPDVSGNPGRVSFSSYFELAGYHDFGLYGTTSLYAGFSVLKGAYTSYKKDFAPIHLELRHTKAIDLGTFLIPLVFSFVINPYTKTCWTALSGGISF